MIARLFVRGGIPAERRVIVVRAGINDAVGALVVRKIEVFRIAPEGELENGHTRKSGGFPQGDDGRRKFAEVFGDEFHRGHRATNFLEEIDARTGLPAARARGRGAGRNRPIGIEAAEMVEAHDIA